MTGKSSSLARMSSRPFSVSEAKKRKPRYSSWSEVPSWTPEEVRVMQLTTGCPVNPARVLACHDRAVQLGPLHVGSRVYPFDAKVGDLVLDAVVVFLFHEQRLLGCTGLTYRFKPLALQGRATAKRLNKQVTTFNQLFAMMEADIRECVAAIEGHRSGARKLALSAYRSTAQG